MNRLTHSSLDVGLACIAGALILAPCCPASAPSRSVPALPPARRYQFPRWSGTSHHSTGTRTTSRPANSTNTWACMIPGCWLRAMIAVVIGDAPYARHSDASWPRMTSSTNSPATHAARRKMPSRVNPAWVAARIMAALSASVSTCIRCIPRTSKP